MTTPAIEVRGVLKDYPDGRSIRRVLDGVDLLVERGELVALMGPSGSGKTTLLHLIAGLTRPDGGTIRVAGTDVGAASPGDLARMRRRSIGYVEQRLNLIGVLTARENVMLPLELDGADRHRCRTDADRALEAVGATGLADLPAEQLSVGEQQRVAIARALVGQRSLLLADEPTAALDSLTGESVMRLLRQRCAEGSTIVVATHDAGHAAWADRVLLLRDGRIGAQIGDPGSTSEVAGSWPQPVGRVES
jgi:putative ABC transport system ATP-binding protein